MHSRCILAGSVLLVALSSCALLTGCGSGSSTDATPTASIAAATPTGSVVESPAAETRKGEEAAPAPAARRRKPDLFPEVVIETSMGNIRVKLNAEKAPRTVSNFLENYADRGFYDETVFHYVDDGFMIAGGGFTADLQPKETRAAIPNESDNGLLNKRGTIAMARHPEYADSATSQFFINLQDNPSLDYQADGEGEKAYGYCVFGEVVEGMDVLDQIAKVDVHDTEQFVSVPVEPVTVHQVRRASSSR